MTSLFEVVPLTADHDPSGFHCGTPDLDVWLRRHAMASHAIGGARTFVSCAGNEVRGYYALAAGAVEFDHVTPAIREGLGRYPVSVIVLARLAVDEREQGRGVGATLLRDALLRCVAVAEQIGVRAVIVHAADDAARAFYERFGFERSPTDPYHLILPMQDIAHALS